MIVWGFKTHFDKGLTCLLWGESKGHDVIYMVRVVGVWRVEGQCLASSAPQVQQVGGVHHGDCKAALPLPFTDGNILWGSPVVALCVSEDPQQSLSCKFSVYILHNKHIFSSYLRSHATPEVGIKGFWFQHGCHYCQILCYHVRQHLAVCQQVVTVHKLRYREETLIDDKGVILMHQILW